MSSWPDPNDPFATEAPTNTTKDSQEPQASAPTSGASNNAYATENPFNIPVDTGGAGNAYADTNVNPFDAAMDVDNGEGGGAPAATGGVYADTTNITTTTTDNGGDKTEDTTDTTSSRDVEDDGNDTLVSRWSGLEFPCGMKSIHCVLILLILSLLMTIIGVVVDELDVCDIGGGDLVYFGIGEAHSEVSSVSITLTYAKACSDDADLYDDYCELQARGIFWLIFVMISWVVFGIIFIIFFAKHLQFKCVVCSHNTIPFLIIIYGVLLILALITWDVNNEEIELVGCDFDGLGASNWLVTFAIVVCLTSVIYGWFVAPGKTFKKL